MAEGKKRGPKDSKELFFNGTYDIDEFHDVFISCADLTEYRAAMQLVGDWQEWNRLKRNSGWFANHVLLWVEELKTRLKSDAMQKIIELAASDSNSAGTAAKWLAEGTWEKEAGRGRPSKAEQRRAAQRIASAAAETEEEKKRMLKVLNGGKVQEG